MTNNPHKIFRKRTVWQRRQAAEHLMVFPRNGRPTKFRGRQPVKYRTRFVERRFLIANSAFL